MLHAHRFRTPWLNLVGRGIGWRNLLYGTLRSVPTQSFSIQSRSNQVLTSSNSLKKNWGSNPGFSIPTFSSLTEKPGMNSWGPPGWFILTSEWPAAISSELRSWSIILQALIVSCASLSNFSRALAATLQVFPKNRRSPSQAATFLSITSSGIPSLISGFIQRQYRNVRPLTNIECAVNQVLFSLEKRFRSWDIKMVCTALL